MEKSEFIKYIPHTTIKIDSSKLSEKEKHKLYYDLLDDFNMSIIGVPFAHIINLGKDTNVIKLQDKIPYQMFGHDGDLYAVIENQMLLKEDKEKLLKKYPEFKSVKNIVTSWMGITFENTVEGRLT